LEFCSAFARDSFEKGTTQNSHVIFAPLHTPFCTLPCGTFCSIDAEHPAAAWANAAGVAEREAIGRSTVGGAGGSSTAGVFPPVKDAEHLPITEGGTVKTGPIVFQDIAAKAGLTKWHHEMGTPQKRYILESIGSGVALLDYDNDGWMDIYLVNGSTQAAIDGKAMPPHAALFHNNHDGTFTDVTAKADVANDRWGFGVGVGDYDNDGWPDIYVSNFGKNRLYHNNLDGTFTNDAEKPAARWATDRRTQ
jgi:FG-GAP-like repeat